MNLKLREARFEDQRLVFELFRSAEIYFKKIDGQAPTPRTVQLEMQGRPEIQDPAYLKNFFFICLEDKDIGVVDLHIHHPEKTTATFGVVLLREDHQAKGLGRAAYTMIEDYLRQVHHITKIQLGVSDQNDVEGFWRKMGFTSTGQTTEWQGEQQLNVLTQYEKNLI